LESTRDSNVWRKFSQVIGNFSEAQYAVSVTKTISSHREMKSQYYHLGSSRTIRFYKITYRVMKKIRSIVVGILGSKEFVLEEVA